MTFTRYDLLKVLDEKSVGTLMNILRQSLNYSQKGTYVKHINRWGKESEMYMTVNVFDLDEAMAYMEQEVECSPHKKAKQRHLRTLMKVKDNLTKEENV
jgi:predicted phosphatase